MIETLREYVKAGTEKLDAYDPHWRLRVNPDTLVMASIHDCLLGQVFKHEATRSAPWGFGCDALDILKGDAWKFGFEAPDEAYANKTTSLVFVELADLWAAVVRG
jgi:hypothetical protein